MNQTKPFAALLVVGALLLLTVPVRAATTAPLGIVLADGVAQGSRTVVLRIDQVAGDPVVANLSLVGRVYPSAGYFLVPSGDGTTLAAGPGVVAAPHAYGTVAWLRVGAGPATLEVGHRSTTRPVDNAGSMVASTAQPGDDNWTAWANWSGVAYLAIAYASSSPTSGSWSWHAESAHGLSSAKVLFGDAAFADMGRMNATTGASVDVPGLIVPWGEHFAPGTTVAALAKTTFVAKHASGSALAFTQLTSVSSFQLKGPTTTESCDPCSPLKVYVVGDGPGTYELDVDWGVVGPVYDDLTFFAWSVDSN